MGLDPMLRPQFDHQFIKGQVTLFLDPPPDPDRHAHQLAMPTPVALRLGLKRPRGALQKSTMSFTNLIETRNCAAAARSV